MAHFTTSTPRLVAAMLCVAVVLAAGPAAAIERVEFRRDGTTHRVLGQVKIQAQDGGLMLETPDGTLWNITPEELVSRSSDDRTFQRLTSSETVEQLRRELGPGFEAHVTAHYVILYNTSKPFAQWCGVLFERLYSAFYTFWNHKGIKLDPPPGKLIAIVFADSRSFTGYGQAELSDGADHVVAFYSLRSNRMALYDLTGEERLRKPGDRRSNPQQINRMLARPEAADMVATVIHEATHQLAFNSGLHARYADIPLWLCEGLAMYFESPDLQNSKGWRTIGSVNRPRLELFRRSLAQRTPETLLSLIQDDQRFRNARTAREAYAEAWALNYFLLKQRQKEYLTYLQMLSKKSPLVWDTPAARRKEFEDAFGTLSVLESEFSRSLKDVQ